MTDAKLYKEWHKAKEDMFKMGEERGEKDVRPRDMPATTALKTLPSRKSFLGLTSILNMVKINKRCN